MCRRAKQSVAANSWTTSTGSRPAPMFVTSESASGSITAGPTPTSTSSSCSTRRSEMTIEPGDNILYMKVGTHASEELSDIIGRKRAEIQAEGMAFWGYGGNTCHPSSMVRPFAMGSVGPIVLAMKPMASKHFAEPVRAEEYSEDGIKWRPVPEGINCRG